jgi:hypothetical protein
MAGENASKVVDAEQDESDARQRSTIGFPYNNLGDAIEVAQAIHSNVGTGDCDDSQLSAWMNMSPKSSGYRVQLSAARMFGLIESTSRNHKLSAFGRMAVDPQREREARARAFMNVPLYKAIFEKYKNGVLPPPAALEREANWPRSSGFRAIRRSGWLFRAWQKSTGHAWDRSAPD